MKRFFSVLSPTLPRRLNLVSMDWTRQKDPPMSLGHAAILANLKKREVDVFSQSYSVNHLDFSAKKVSSFIMSDASPTTDVALGAFVWNEKYLQEILNNLKEQNFPGRIILGGPQVSYVKKGIENYYPQADIFIRGYAEEALADLMLSRELHPEIQGVHYAGKEDKGLSAAADLEKLPSPFLSSTIAPQRFIRFETQRGCPFRCAFCQHRESDPSKKRRGFGLDRVLQEIDWITENKIIQDIAVLDPTFNSEEKARSEEKKRHVQIIERFAHGKYSGKLSLQIRLEMISPEFLDAIDLLNKTGHVVLEAGIQTINKGEQKIIDRPNNMTKVSAALQELKKRGIEVETSLIFGLPGQTVESFEESIKFCKDMQVSKVYAFPLMLLRGTPLHSMKKLYQLTESSDINLEGINRLQADIPHVVSSYSFNEDDWKKMAAIAEGLETYNNRLPSSIILPKISSKELVKFSGMEMV